jgi:outer membrane murein-binding lipoprotein Lpp
VHLVYPGLRMKTLVQLITTLLISSLFLAGCGYVSESQLDECSAALSAQQETIEAQQKEIEELMRGISLNRIQWDTFDRDSENLEGRLQEVEASALLRNQASRAYVTVGFRPSSPECEADMVSWTVMLTETGGVGVTFTESVIWYRVFEGHPSGGNRDVSYHSSGTDPVSFPLRLNPLGVVVCEDMSVSGCFSEERHYYHAFFGRDDNGNDIVVAGKVIVND